MIYCWIHNQDVEIDDNSHGLYWAGVCSGDGNEHIVEVEAS